MSQRRCPKCKVDMSTQTLLGVVFDTCPLCTGVWLDEGELQAVTRCRGEALAVTVKPEVKTQYLCPCCEPARLLFEGGHSLSSDFLLDICQACGGLWFDRGEFPSLLQNQSHP